MDIERARRLAEEGDLEAALEYYRMVKRRGGSVDLALALWLKSLPTGDVDGELAKLVSNAAPSSFGISAVLLDAMFDTNSLKMVREIIRLSKRGVFNLVQDAVYLEFERRMVRRLNESEGIVRASTSDRDGLRLFDFRRDNGMGIGSVSMHCVVERMIHLPEDIGWDPGDGYEYPEFSGDIVVHCHTSVAFADYNDDEDRIYSEFSVSNYGPVEDRLLDMFDGITARRFDAQDPGSSSGSEDISFLHVPMSTSLSGAIEESFGFWDLFDEYFLRILPDHADRFAVQSEGEITARCRRQAFADHVNELLVEHVISSREMAVFVGPYGEITVRDDESALFELNEEALVDFLEFLRQNELAGVEEVLDWLTRE